MQYLIKRRMDTRFAVFPPKVVTGDINNILEAYPGWFIYVYRETKNPVSVPDSHTGDFRIRREVLPNMWNNHYCIWKEI